MIKRKHPLSTKFQSWRHRGRQIPPLPHHASSRLCWHPPTPFARRNKWTAPNAYCNCKSSFPVHKMLHLYHLIAYFIMYTKIYFLRKNEDVICNISSASSWQPWNPCGHCISSNTPWGVCIHLWVYTIRSTHPVLLYFGYFGSGVLPVWHSHFTKELLISIFTQLTSKSPSMKSKNYLWVHPKKCLRKRPSMSVWGKFSLVLFCGTLFSLN